MTKTIKLDGKNNYLIDRATGEIVTRYDSENQNLQLVIQLDNSELEVDATNIKKDFGDQIVVKYNNDLFIIDDGFQPILIKCGYVVSGNYDQEMYNGNDGLELTNSIFLDVMNGLRTYIQNTPNYIIEQLDDEKRRMIQFTSEGYRFYVSVHSVSAIVSKNQLRKDNSLPFYPFDKKMDKYGTVYLNIFAEKIDTEVKPDIKYTIANTIVKHTLLNMGPQYHFVPQIVKRRIILSLGSGL